MTAPRPDSVGRVLMVSSLWPPVSIGGAEMYASELADRLRARGWTVGVLTLGVDGADVVEQVKPIPYRLDQFATQSAAARALFHALDVYRPATARALARAVHTFTPDVVHTHSVQGLSSTALAAPSKQGIAHVHTLHDYWLLCQRASLVKRSGASCDHRCWSCSTISGIRNRVITGHPPDAVLAVSEAIAREHQQLDWLRPRLRVVHNPIAAVAHSSRRVPDSTSITFGYLGQLTTSKGIASLVAAFRTADIPGARLLVAGDGPMRAELVASAGEGIDVLGRVDGSDKEAFFEHIDCLVVPSEWKDPAPLVVNEARARAIPVIGADIGGIPELLAPASRSLSFPAGERAALVARLEQFARTPAAYADASDEILCDWDDHLDLVAAAYADARRTRSTDKA